MRTSAPEKLLKVVDEIDADGYASLTRLTVLKKWFENPKRLSAFSLWAASRAVSRKAQKKVPGYFVSGESAAISISKAEPAAELPSPCGPV